MRFGPVFVVGAPASAARPRRFAASSRRCGRTSQNAMSNRFAWAASPILPPTQRDVLAVTAGRAAWQLLIAKLHFRLVMCPLCLLGFWSAPCPPLVPPQCRMFAPFLAHDITSFCHAFTPALTLTGNKRQTHSTRIPALVQHTRGIGMRCYIVSRSVTSVNAADECDAWVLCSRGVRYRGPSDSLCAARLPCRRPKT